MRQKLERMRKIKIAWKSGVNPYNADAEKVAGEIAAVGDSATPAQILELARDSSTELHKCFEWDDSKAAEKYRLIQAAHVARNLVIIRDNEPDDSAQIRLLHVTTKGEGYKPITVIKANQDEYQRLLDNARSDLKVFQQKYHTLAELDAVMDAIDEVLS